MSTNRPAANSTGSDGQDSGHSSRFFSDSRLHGFSDAVFALSATLLVVTLEVPGSYQELLDAVSGFPAFAIGFGMLVMIWYQHRRFFHLYPLADVWTIVINSVLLFVVLLYVYPLKLLTEVFAERYLGATHEIIAEMGQDEIRGLFVIFGLGFAAVYASFGGLHFRAWQQREDLGLDQLARFDLRHEVMDFMMIALIGVLSVFVALLGLGLGWGFPGWLFLLTPVVTIGHQMLISGRRKQIIAARDAA
jgi:uncharacterized membrane protein